METACNYVFFDEVFSLKWKNLETSHVRKVEKCKELRQGYFPLFSGSFIIVVFILGYKHLLLHYFLFNMKIQWKD